MMIFSLAAISRTSTICERSTLLEKKTKKTRWQRAVVSLALETIKDDIRSGIAASCCSLGKQRHVYRATRARSPSRIR